MPIEAKICGLRDLATAQAAHEAGAAWLGFIFHPGSPRHIGLADLPGIAAGLPVHARSVAVTVDASDETLAAIVAALAPSVLQLHGQESPERTRALGHRFGLPIIKAVGVTTASDVARAATYDTAADYLLFDTKLGADTTGGTGKSFDWSLLSAYKGALPWFLSGGLASDNLAAAVQATGAGRVDASSRLESAPGVKDVGRIHAFLTEADRLP